eukprot:scaffold4601_cov146-Ochromonas_danica.AAC.2
MDGGPCYPGHYCPEGTVTPVSCPNGTVRASAYGVSADDCGPCPAGYTCEVGNPVPIACPRGMYCPKGTAGFDCPIGTYNSLLSRASLDDCLLCPAGYFCNATAVTNYTRWPCPLAHYCLIGTADPLPCPAGTYRNAVGAAKQADCFVCPGGYYCLFESSTIIECPAHYYCPSGSSNITICPPGYYCPARTANPVICPESYYCPLGTSIPKPCYFGTYCPAGTDFPIPCPLGYRAVSVPNNTLSVLGSLPTACQECPGGYYGNDPNRLECYLGLPGYYYIGGATTDKPTNLTTERGDICPKGYYCPAGTETPISCPVGTYQPAEGGYNASQCLSCPANTYQNSVGSGSCLQCSSSSVAAVGSTVCQCVGKNRIFQPSDGWCICQPGYEFVDSNLIVSSTSDGSYDCQPIVRPRCATSQTRMYDGSCATDSYCDNVCGSGGGSISETFGTCICSNATTLDEACDSTCRSQAVQVSCDSDGSLVEYDPTTGTKTTLSTSSLTSQGSIDCSYEGKVFSMATSSGKFVGYFGVGSTLSGARRRLTEDSFRPHWKGKASANSTKHVESSRFNLTGLQEDFPFERVGSRILATTTATASLSNPYVTIYVGDSLVFDVSKDSYPVYVKDSLLNTNSDFDYSKFRALKEAASTTLSLTSFAFTFTEAGNYVFAISSDSAAITIVTVLNTSIAQSTAAQFVEPSVSNLIVQGVKADDNVVQAPDWNLVMGLLLGMLAIIFLVVGFLYYFRKKAWSFHTKVDAGYRKKNKKGTPDTKTSKGGILPKVKNNKIYADTAEKDKGGEKDDLESAAFNNVDEEVDFDDEMLIPDLAKHMQSHHDEIDRQLLNQSDMLNNLQDTLKKEVEELKSLLTSTAMDLALNANNDQRSKRLLAILLQLKTDTIARGTYEDNMDTQQSRVAALVSKVEDLLKPGSELLSSSIVKDMVQQAVALSDRDEQIVNIYSPALRNVTDLLAQVKDLVVDVVVPNINEEKRRRQAAEELFDSSVRNLHGAVFPQEVLDCLKPSRDSDLKTDMAINDVLSVLRSFSDHIPQFLSFMNEAEGGLLRGLARTMEKANRSLVENEEEIAKKAFTGYLNDLDEALRALRAPVADRVKKGEVARGSSKKDRQLLLEAIDRALGALDVAPEQDIQQILEPLLAALRGGLTEKQLAAIQSEEGQEQPIEPGAEGGNAEQEVAPTSEENTVLDTKVVDTLLNNESLTADQKVDILDSAENDLKVMDNILELERKKQEEAIQQALEIDPLFNISSLDEEDEEIEQQRKFEEEQRHLKETLQAQRETELAQLKESEEDTAEEVKVSPRTQDNSLASDIVKNARLTALARYWSIHSRMSYKELACKYINKRLKAQKSLYSDGMEAEKLFNTLAEIESEEDKSVDKLNERLLGELDAGEDNEHEANQERLKNSTIDLEKEMGSIKQECSDRLAGLKKRAEILCKAIKANLTIAQDLRHQSMKKACSRIGKDNSEAIMQSLDAETSSLEILLQKLNDDDMRILDNEYLLLLQALDDCHLGPLSEKEIEKQGQLHLSVVSSLQVHVSMQTRLAMTEFSLRKEIEKMNFMTDLRASKTSKEACEQQLKDFDNKKDAEEAALAQQLQDNASKETSAELKRQREVEVNFEKERALMIAVVAHQELKMQLQMHRSLRSIELEVEKALKRKNEVLMKEIDKFTTDPQAKTWAIRKIEAESARQYLEMKLAYDTFEEGLVVCERYATDVVLGVQPSTDFVTAYSEYSSLCEQHIMEAIARSEDSKMKSKASMSAALYKDFEEKRLLELGRPAADLKKLFDDIRIRTTEEHKSIDVATAAELWRVQSSYSEAISSKLVIHSEYAKDVDGLVAAHADRRSRIIDAWQGARQQLLAAKNDAKLKSEGSAVLANIITEDASFLGQLLDAFKSVISKLVGQAKSEDELRHLRHKMLHDSEKMEKTFESSEMDRLNELLSTQHGRLADLEDAEAALESEIDGQRVVLEHKRDQAIDFLKAAAEVRRDERVEELVDGGMSKAEAEKKAQEEMVERLEKDMAAVNKQYDQQLREVEKKAEEATAAQSNVLKDQLNATQSAIENDKPVPDAIVDSVVNALALENEAEMNSVKKDQEAALAQLASSLETERAERERAIQKELDGIEKSRVEELISSGTAPEEARDIAHKEREAAERKAREDLDNELNQKFSTLKKQIEDQFQALLNDLARQLDVSREILQKGVTQATNAELEKAMQSIEQQKITRAKELEAQGIPAEQARAMAEQEALHALEKEKSSIGQFVRNTAEKLKHIAEDNFADRAREIRVANEASLNGLQASLELKKKLQAKHVEERLQKRKKQRVEQLVKAGASKKEAAALAEGEISVEDEIQQATKALEAETEELINSKKAALDKLHNLMGSAKEEQALQDDAEAMALRAELKEKERQMVDMEHQNATTVWDAASAASRNAQDDLEAELRRLREEHEKTMNKLSDDLLAKATREKNNLSKRLAAKRDRRVAELRKEGKSPEEAAAIVAAEEAKLMQELSDTLDAERDRIVGERQKEFVEAQSTLIDRELKRAAAAAANAQSNKDDLQARLAKLRKEHDDELKTLENRFSANRQQQENALKQRLAERKEAKLRGASDANARKEIENQLAEEERQRLLALQKEAAEEEWREKERLRREQEERMAAVLEEAKKAEMDVAIAAAKEAAMKGVKEMQDHAQAELNMREVQRLRAAHEAKEKKRQEEAAQAQGQGKDRLAQRLASKKEKRERELKEQEEKALKELAARQKSEAEEKERLRVAKLSWMEKVQETMAKSKTLGLSPSETEDYCFQETLGRRIVPDVQMNEAVSIVLKPRHDQAMTDLLTANFDERMSALKSAVEKVIEEKSHAKISLVESLAAKGASEDQIKAAMVDLDKEYNQKQLSVEKASTQVLEQKHIQSQMNLKKSHLEEIAKIVALYTDPETLARIQKASGVSQEEALAAYKARIESEKRAREEALNKERIESEAALRAKLQEDMAKIQKDLEEEQKKAEAEFDRKRQEMERQKEELRKKQEQDMGTLDHLEKQRIMTNFEKEQAAALEALDREKQNKKAKLADRLNRRRNAAVVVPTQQPSEQLVKSSEAVLAKAESMKTLVKSAAAGSTTASAAVLPDHAFNAFQQSMQVIESKLERIEKVVSALEKSGISSALAAAAAPPVVAPPVPAPAPEPEPVPTPTPAPVEVAPAPRLPSYSDRDEPTPGEKLELVAEEDLAVQERARLDFGRRLAVMVGLKTLEIRAAASLPPSTATNNAFCNSYYYSAAENCLLVHNQRLSSSGDFGLVVVHAFSHIKVSSNLCFLLKLISSMLVLILGLHR